MNTLDPIPSRWRLLAAFGVILLPLAAAADEPIQGTPLVDHSLEAVESIQAESGPVTFQPERFSANAPTLEPRAVPADANHRGGVFTDGGSGAVTSDDLTANERLKLDAALAAVEASRAAGTLLATSSEEDGALFPRLMPEVLAAHKLQRLEELKSIPTAPSPISGVGVEFPAVQESGSPGLNALEEEKLRGVTAAPGQPVQPVREGSSDE